MWRYKADCIETRGCDLQLPVFGHSKMLRVMESDDNIPWRDAFPEFHGNESDTVLSGYCYREGVTQMQLSEASGSMS
jgi:hypothetical protein